MQVVEVAIPTVNEVMVHQWIEAMVALIVIAVLIEDIPVIEDMGTGKLINFNCLITLK